MRVPGKAAVILLPALLLIQAAPALERPSEVVREATLAAEGDSATLVAARWRAALAGDSTNVVAHLALGTVARLTYDFPGADRHFNVILGSSRAPATYRAWAALGGGLSRLYRTHFDTASAWLVRAASIAREANDSVAYASAMIAHAIARIRAESGQHGREILDTAMRATPIREKAVLAGVHCARSHLKWYFGDPSGAVTDAEVGLALVRQQLDRRTEVFCLQMLGGALLARGDERRAKAVFDTSMTVAARAHDRLAAAVSLWWRGHTALEYYEHDEAQRDLSASLIEAEASGNRYITIFAWIRLAIVSWHFGDLVSARQQLERGRAVARELGDAWGVVYARNVDGGLALDAGQIDAAERAFRDELAWAEQVGSSIELFTARYGLGRVAFARRDWLGARRIFAEAERVARKQMLLGLIPQLEYERALISLRAGDLDDAERRFRAVLASKDLADLDRYSTRMRIAEVELLRGDPVRAKRDVIEATDALDSLRARLGERELRVLAFQARKGYDDSDLGFSTIISGLAAAGEVQAALSLAERRRARELRDQLVRLADLTPTPALASNSPVSAAPLADDRTAVLEYVAGTGSQPTTLFVQTQGGTWALRLASAESLSVDIKAFSGLIEAGASASALASSLGEAVLGGALDSLPATVSHVVVVADGPLQRVPFDALRLRDGRYVVERFAVTLAPSIAVARELKARAARVGATRLLAIGDPQFANEVTVSTGSAADVFREAFSANGGLPRLRGSAEEARLVARYAHHADLRLREQASERYLKSAPLDSFDIIHLATHALVDETSAARTALAVAAGDGDDGFLGPGELSSLRLAAQLVVLSACRTAQGVAVRGEGVQGLTAPLLAAGARSVLATQWRIRDTDAVKYIDDFYRALAAGTTVSEAARAAKLAALKRGATPAAWAAFTVVGDPFATIPLRTPNDYGRWLILAGVVALGIVIYRVGVRRRRVEDRRSVPSGSTTVTPQ